MLDKRAWQIVAAGLAVRLAMLLVIDPASIPFSGDSAYYAAGHFDGFRAPLYIAFLKLTLPAGIWLPLVIQSALTILSGVVAYRLLGNFLAGLLIAACPLLVFFDFRLLSESLYINLLWLAWVLIRRNPWTAGVFLGLSVLTRDTLVLLPLFSLLFLRTKSALQMALVAYAVALPWYVAGPSGHSRLGTNLWIGTWERNGDWYLHGLTNAEFPDYAFISASERQEVTSHWMKNDRAILNVAASKILGHPVTVAKAWLFRYPKLWISTRSDHSVFRAPRMGLVWTIEKSFFFGLNIAFLLFGLWGLLRPDWTFVPPVIYAAVVYIPLHAEARYVLFAFPFLIYLGARRVCEWSARRAFRPATMLRPADT